MFLGSILFAVSLFATTLLFQDFKIKTEIANNFKQIDKEEKIIKATQLYIKIYDDYPESELDLLAKGLLNEKDLFVLMDMDSSMKTKTVNKFTELVKTYRNHESFDAEEYRNYINGNDYATLPIYVKNNFTQEEYDLITSLEGKIALDANQNIDLSLFQNTAQKEKLLAIRNKRTLNYSSNENSVKLQLPSKTAIKIDNIKMDKAAALSQKIAHVEAIKKLNDMSIPTTISLTQTQMDTILENNTKALKKLFTTLPLEDQEHYFTKIKADAILSKNQILNLVKKEQRYSQDPTLANTIATTTTQTLDTLKPNIIQN